MLKKVKLLSSVQPYPKLAYFSNKIDWKMDLHIRAETILCVYRISSKLVSNLEYTKHWSFKEYKYLHIHPDRTHQQYSTGKQICNDWDYSLLISWLLMKKSFKQWYKVLRKQAWAEWCWLQECKRRKLPSLCSCRNVREGK